MVGTPVPASTKSATHDFMSGGDTFVTCKAPHLSETCARHVWLPGGSRCLCDICLSDPLRELLRHSPFPVTGGVYAATCDLLEPVLGVGLVLESPGVFLAAGVDVARPYCIPLP